MRIDLAELRRACTVEEAALRLRLTEVARLFQPPLTRRRRAQLVAELAAAKDVYHHLSRLWASHLAEPSMFGLPPLHPDRRHFDALRGRLAEAPAGFDALTRVLRQGAQPLLPDPLPPDRPESVQMALQDRAWSKLHAAIAPVPLGAHIRDNGQYDDIAYPVADFLRLLLLARRVAVALGKAEVRFLDVGCGTGLKVLMAAEMFGQTDGLEYLPGLAQAAETLLHRAGSRSHILTADALQFDGFGDYDLIYFYKPIHTPKDLADMEARIAAQVKSGTILIAPYAGFAHRAEALGCFAIAGFVHIKGITGKDLDRLKRRAEWAGFGDPRPQPVAAESFMAPLLGALRAWGQLP